MLAISSLYNTSGLVKSCMDFTAASAFFTDSSFSISSFDTSGSLPCSLTISAIFHTCLFKYYLRQHPPTCFPGESGETDTSFIYLHNGLQKQRHISPVSYAPQDLQVPSEIRSSLPLHQAALPVSLQLQLYRLLRSDHQ